MAREMLRLEATPALKEAANQAWISPEPYLWGCCSATKRGSRKPRAPVVYQDLPGVKETRASRRLDRFAGALGNIFPDGGVIVDLRCTGAAVPCPAAQSFCPLSETP